MVGRAAALGIRSGTMLPHSPPGRPASCCLCYVARRVEIWSDPGRPDAREGGSGCQVRWRCVRSIKVEKGDLENDWGTSPDGGQYKQWAGRRRQVGPGTEASNGERAGTGRGLDLYELQSAPLVIEGAWNRFDPDARRQFRASRRDCKRFVVIADRGYLLPRRSRREETPERVGDKARAIEQIGGRASGIAKQGFFVDSSKLFTLIGEIWPDPGRPDAREGGSGCQVR